MKALLSVAPGGPETLSLTEIPVPQPGTGELRVRMTACSINYPDVLVIEDKYQMKPPRPFAPGGEVAGIVEEAGEGVTGWSAGDRVIGLCMAGGLAEQVILRADKAVRLPDDRDPVQGAALILTYATTLHALADRGELKQGETLLVLGAAGGVGIAAIEIGKAMGATVVAAVSTEEKAQAARAAGADRTLVYSRAPFDRDQSKELSAALKDVVGPNGADVIYDPVGGDYVDPALRAIAWGGRYLVIGFTAGIPKLPLNLTLLKSCDIRGVFWGAFAERDPAKNAAHLQQLMTWWQEGVITPRIDRTYTLAEGGEAIARLARREAIGKIVVVNG